MCARIWRSPTATCIREPYEDMSSEPAPIVSIGMAVRNEARFLHEAIASLLAQDFTDFELIISDNASTDGTEEVCRSYERQDPRVRYFRNPVDIGAIPNFNRVFRFSSGRFFMWAGGHDVWAPEFIARCVDLMESDQTVVLAFTQAQYIDVDGVVMPDWSGDWHFDTRGVAGNIPRFMTFLCSWPSPGLFYGLIRSEALEHTGLNTRCGTPDFVLLAELSLLGAFGQIPARLVKFRVVRPTETTAELSERYQGLVGAGGSRGFRLPFLRAIVEFARVPLRSELSWSRRVFLLLFTVPMCVFRLKPWIKPEISNYIRFGLRRVGRVRGRGREL